MSFFFNSDFDTLNSELLTLKIKEKNIGNDTLIPYYWYDIYLTSTKEKIGDISIRIGKNYHSYYNGHIGYFIEPCYRGHHYAYYAALMVLDVAEYYDMKEIYMTCEMDNIASYKTIEHVGGELIEIVVPPKDYFAYYDGISSFRVYKINLKKKKGLK